MIALASGELERRARVVAGALHHDAQVHVGLPVPGVRLEGDEQPLLGSRVVAHRDELERQVVVHHRVRRGLGQLGLPERARARPVADAELGADDEPQEHQRARAQHPSHRRPPPRHERRELRAHPEAEARRGQVEQPLRHQHPDGHHVGHRQQGHEGPRHREAEQRPPGAEQVARPKHRHPRRRGRPLPRARRRHRGDLGDVGEVRPQREGRDEQAQVLGQDARGRAGHRQRRRARRKPPRRSRRGHRAAAQHDVRHQGQPQRERIPTRARQRPPRLRRPHPRLGRRAPPPPEPSTR